MSSSVSVSVARLASATSALGGRPEETEWTSTQNSSPSDSRRRGFDVAYVPTVARIRKFFFPLSHGKNFCCSFSGPANLLHYSIISIIQSIARPPSREWGGRVDPGE